MPNNLAHKTTSPSLKALIAASMSTLLSFASSASDITIVHAGRLLADPAGNVTSEKSVIIKDGVISADELEKATASLKSLDADGDGTISADEMRNAMRASFGGGRGGAGGRGGGGRGGGPGSPGSSTLERAGLALNQAAPDVTIHDDKGGNVRLADFKGKHTVIVFGCLT